MLGQQIRELGASSSIVADSQLGEPCSAGVYERDIVVVFCPVNPAALTAFEPWRNGLCRPEARELLKVAPTPTRAARLTRTQLEAALKRASRKRGITAEAERLRDVFREDYAHQPPLVEDALGKQMLALLVQLEAACTAADDLTEAVEEAFPQHPDAGDSRPLNAATVRLPEVATRVGGILGQRCAMREDIQYVQDDGRSAEVAADVNVLGTGGLRQ